MIEKLKAFVTWVLTSKVGNGFAFILYMAMVLAYGLIQKASAEAVFAALFAGLGVQTGQRTYTQVSLTKATIKNGNKTIPNVPPPPD
jgi:hypothetical protein